MYQEFILATDPYTTAELIKLSRRGSHCLSGPASEARRAGGREVTRGRQGQTRTRTAGLVSAPLCRGGLSETLQDVDTPQAQEAEERKEAQLPPVPAQGAADKLRRQRVHALGQEKKTVAAAALCLPNLEQSRPWPRLTPNHAGKTTVGGVVPT